MGKSILVCDKAAFMRKIVTENLKKGGYEIAGEAESGAEAIEKANKLQPDLVLLDMFLPETDSIQVLKEIRKDHNINVIMIVPLEPMHGIPMEELLESNDTDMVRARCGFTNMKMDAVMSGASGFLQKPFRPEDLLKEVKKVIG